MRKSRFTDEQMVAILREADGTETIPPRVSAVAGGPTPDPVDEPVAHLLAKDPCERPHDARPVIAVLEANLVAVS